jgi:hypothetical protein
MASSEVLNSLPSNGHLDNVQREDTTSSKQGISETDLEEAQDEPRSAQLEGTVSSPVLDNPTAGQPLSKGKPTGSPIKPSVPILQTATGKAALSGPPTPQVKKVLARFMTCDTVLWLFFSDTPTLRYRF